MNSFQPPAMAAEKSHVQESAAFEEVTVYLTEEIQFDFDPYLFALSGSNLQQYCTLLSWLEMRNHKSELILEAEEGRTPLSLVHVVEEFETSPCLYQGDEAAQTKEPENVMPLARLQYNFSREANLPTRSSEFFLTGRNASLFPELPRGHPNAERPLKDFSTAVPPQGGSLPARAPCAALQPHGSGVVPLGREQNEPQDAVRFSAVAGDSSPTEGRPSERSHLEKKSHPRTSAEADVNKLPTSEAHEERCAGEAPCTGSNSAVKHLNPIPATHQQVSPKDLPTFRCPTCSHPFKCSIASLGGKEVNATGKWERPFSPLSLNPVPKEKAGKVEKPFKCPDCGKGFLHRSSIPRHQRLHKKENSSPKAGQPMPYHCSNCGTTFAVKSAAIKHRKLHEAERLFKCLSCDKSYSQKSHLKRHEQQKHQATHPTGQLL